VAGWWARILHGLLGMQTETHEIHPKDRIYETITLRTSRGRVWLAISDARKFGAWFGASFDRAFAPGERVTGVITPTTVDPEVAAEQQPYDGMAMQIWIDRIEPERLFSFRWHPFAVDEDADFDAEPKTLVTFELKDDPEGVVLTITESGFAELAPERSAKAFAANEQGWEKQLRLIQKYVGSQRISH
jgi:uncharacterized protein YndB with AHSA1/START domain